MPREKAPSPAASAPKTEERERQPSHKVYSVEDRQGGDPFWTRIGSAFPHKDGKGLNIILSAMPLNNRIVLRAVEPQAAEEAGSNQPSETEKKGHRWTPAAYDTDEKPTRKR